MPGNVPEAPDRRQTLLLRAALCNGTRAIDCWTESGELPAPKEMDHASQWLFPLLYRNLLAQGVSEDRLLIYRSVYRHNWYKNILMLECLRRIAREVKQRAITFLTCGSAALTPAVYHDMGIRPIRSLDFICAGDVIHSLAPIFNALGWSPDAPAGAYKDRLGRRILVKPVEEIADNTLFDRQETVVFKEEQIPLLDRTTHGQLILSLNQAWDSGSSLLWMADIVTMFHSAEERTQRYGAMPEFTQHLELIDTVLAIS